MRSRERSEHAGYHRLGGHGAGGVRGRDLLLLLALAALWSASFLFIKVAVAEVTPTFIVLARLVFGSLTLLLAIPFLRNRIPELLSPKDGRGVPKCLISLRWPLLFLGAVNAVAPYTAIAWGEKFITSGMASIFNATVPLFTALLVLTLPFFPEERPNLLDLAGLLLSFAGVGLLVTGEPGGTGDSTQAAQLLGGGAVLLDETFTLRALVGLALILAGVAGVTGALRLPKRFCREPPVP